MKLKKVTDETVVSPEDSATKVSSVAENTTTNISNTAGDATGTMKNGASITTNTINNGASTEANAINNGVSTAIGAFNNGQENITNGISSEGQNSTPDHGIGNFDFNSIGYADIDNMNSQFNKMGQFRRQPKPQGRIGSHRK